jgi:cytochrome c556
MRINAGRLQNAEHFKGLRMRQKGGPPMSSLPGFKIGGACLAAALTVASSVAFGQDPNPASPKDIIVARKTLMNTIGTNMYPIDQMLQTGKIDVAAARIPLESISAMLLAFPLLFPPSTNLWYPNATRDPATDTLADASIWESRSFFYRDTLAASKYAFDASRAQTVPDFRKAAMDLRLTCDGCHSTYQHKD